MPAIVLAVVLGGCGGGRVIVHGDTMAPAIKDGDGVVYQEYGGAEPRRSDIVIVKHAGILRVLRVIGLPGETVTIANGVVSIGGTALVEPYLTAGTRTESSRATWPVPPDSYFLLVDHRASSGADSRNPDLGFVPRSEIVGKAKP